MKKKGIIFDLDGTLLDTLDDLWKSTNFALERYGYPVRTREEVRLFVGNGVRLLMERAVPRGLSEEDFEKVFACFKAHYKEHCKDQTGAYPGVEKLLKQLTEKGHPLAIVSNKMDPAVKELNKEFFEPVIKVAIGESEGVRKKPAPDTLYKAMELLGIEKEDAIYVGDSEVDIRTAKNADIPCISVCWGFRSEAFLLENGAKHLIYRPEEMMEKIEELS